MVVAKGYKQTEVGVIPEDWSVVTLGELGESIIGLTYSPANVREFGTLVLRSSNIQNSRLVYDNNVFVDMELPQRVFVKEDDILICVRNGSKQLIGKCTLIDSSAVGAAFGAFMTIYRSPLNKYIIHQFRSNVILKQITEVMGATINQITNKDLSGFKVPCPPTLEERDAIAEALSDMDALISSLEQQIEKKKVIKQGMMQELLKPKEGWVTRKLGEIGKCHRGVSYNPESDLHQFDKANTIRLLRSNNIQQQTVDLNGLQFVDEKRVKPNQILQDNDIVICMANGSKQLVGKSGVFHLNDQYLYTFGAFMGCFRTDPKLAISSFVALTFQTDNYRSYIDVLLSGSSINNLNPSNIESIEIFLPPLPEQVVISSIIGDIKKEIFYIGTKLSKLKEQKQAMMQSLLTGKIRLV